MKKNLMFLAVLAVVIFLSTESFAQMINYDRLKKRAGGATPPSQAGTSQATQTKAIEQAPLPKWLATPPVVNNKFEAEYDVNRDKKLQSSEVKMMLRDILDELKDKGDLIPINTDILKEYDKNKDGALSDNEAMLFEKIVR